MPVITFRKEDFKETADGLAFKADLENAENFIISVQRLEADNSYKEIGVELQALENTVVVSVNKGLSFDGQIVAV